MKTILDDVFIKSLPTIDLHGETRDSARIMVNDFINDNYLLKNKIVVIIHGIGTGALRDETHKILKKSKKVDEFHLNHYNSGCTIVYIKDKPE